VALVFAPGRADMYPVEPLVTVDPGPAGQVLEGEFRPGFFGGVLTVVLKLFQLVRPEIAVFGQKDAQQLALIRRMTADLDLGVAIESVPTVRDRDLLAISSRNVYLSAEERLRARAIPRATWVGFDAARSGPAAVLAATKDALETYGVAVDYVSVVDPATFMPVDEAHTGPAILAIAARVGRTRLIDNVPLTFAE
jgi:pantoate--beta-alanine ligase